MIHIFKEKGDFRGCAKTNKIELITDDLKVNLLNK